MAADFWPKWYPFLALCGGQFLAYMAVGPVKSYSIYKNKLLVTKTTQQIFFVAYGRVPFQENYIALNAYR